MSFGRASCATNAAFPYHILFVCTGVGQKRGTTATNRSLLRVCKPVVYSQPSRSFTQPVPALALASPPRTSEIGTGAL